MPTDAPRRAGSLAVAAVLLALPLALPHDPARPAPGLPLELPLLVVLLAAVGAPLRLAATALLMALLTLKLLDLATGAALGRPFNPILDMPLVAAGWRLAAGSLGAPLALAAAAGLAAGLAATAAGLWWASGRAAAIRRPALFALVLPLLAIVALDAGGRFDPPGTAASTRLAARHLGDAWRARDDLARFRVEAAADRWAVQPPERILPALTGRDVLLIFVESYGRSAHANPRYAATVAAALAEAEARLADSGLVARSTWLAAPVVGGQSWLARATALSGLTVDSEARYRALLASPRRTLLHLAQAAGWRIAGVMPAITLPWPEAGWFGYDRLLAAKDIGYRGKPFNWVTMPDQFTLAALERRLLAPGPRPRVFAEVALISSHAPWTPIPPILPWEALGDGRVFDGFAGAGDPPEVVWRDPDRVREQYRRSLDYSLRVVAAFAERRAATRPLVVVLGDHQPAPFVSGDTEGRDVPVHLIGPPEVLAGLDPAVWSPGLLPPPDASARPMRDLRDLLLAGFDEAPATRQAAAESLPPAARR